MTKKDKKNLSMKKNILQTSFSKLINIIDYKCVQFGIVVKYVDPKFTSKTCSYCDYINYDLKYQKEWTCPNCNKVLDRDVNAAINILNDINGKKLLKK